MNQKIKPSDLMAEAQPFIASREMPSLEALLEVISETREKYAPASFRREKGSDDDTE